MTPMTGPSSHFYRSKTFRRALDWRGVHKLQEFWISYRGVTIKHTWSIWSKMISWWFEADKNYPWKIWPLIIIHSWNPPINQSYKKQLCFFSVRCWHCSTGFIWKWLSQTGTRKDWDCHSQWLRMPRFFFQVHVHPYFEALFRIKYVIICWL